MSHKFVIVGAPRTGSTLLVKTLNSIDGVCCHGELLGPEHVRGYEDGFDLVNASNNERLARTQHLLQERNSDPVDFIKKVLAPDRAATGFKALYSAFLNPRWHEVRTFLLATPNISFIHLTRGNSLRRFISEQILHEGGPNHSGAGGKSETQIKVRVDIDAFQQRSAELERECIELTALLSGQRVLNITYEELAADTASAVQRVSHFIGLDVETNAIAPALQKVGAKNLGDVVSNYQDLLKHPATSALALVD